MVGKHAVRQKQLFYIFIMAIGVRVIGLVHAAVQLAAATHKHSHIHVGQTANHVWRKQLN